jgi:hypothetical protein
LIEGVLWIITIADAHGGITSTAAPSTATGSHTADTDAASENGPTTRSSYDGWPRLACLFPFVLLATTATAAPSTSSSNTSTSASWRFRDTLG